MHFSFSVLHLLNMCSSGGSSMDSAIPLLRRYWFSASSFEFPTHSSGLVMEYGLLLQ